MKRKMTSVKLSEEERVFLEEVGHGRIAAGIRNLIQEKKERIEGKEIKKEIDERFWECVVLPEDAHSRETFCAFVNVFIGAGEIWGALDFYMSRICSMTGYDENTVRKHFRRLGGYGYLKWNNVVMRPTLRLHNEVDKEKFKELYEEYVEFILRKGKFVDIGEELWEKV